MRINTIVIAQTSVDLMLSVMQTFSFYPESQRDNQLPVFDMPRVPHFLGAVPRSRIYNRQGILDNKSINLIEQSSSFFLATSSGNKECTVPATAIGCDVAFRQGLPGFVTVESRHTSRSFHILRWTETVGNTLLISMGNIALYPRAGLLFLDWCSGDMLQITGSVEILSDQSNLSGNQRVLELTVYMYIFTSSNTGTS